MSFRKTSATVWRALRGFLMPTRQPFGSVEERPSHISCCRNPLPGRFQTLDAAEHSPCNPQRSPCRFRRVQFHSGADKLHCLFFRVEVYVLVAYFGEDDRNFFLARQATGSLVKAPQLHQRPTAISKAPLLSRLYARHAESN